MTRSLVTGAAGFAGGHLVDELLRSGDEVVNAVHRLPETTASARESRSVEQVAFELEDRRSVESLVRDHRVDRIFHLAGLASVSRALQDSVSPFRVNVIGTLFLLESIAELRRREDYAPTILIAGSGDVYGASAERHRPLSEDAPLEPLNPYAVSKAAQELLGLQFHRAHDLPIIVTRSFNHIGPGQKGPFVAVELAEQVRAAANGRAPATIRLGNPDIRRDFTDVRDVVRAYRLLTEEGTPGAVYNVCAGESWSIRELAEIMLEVAGCDARIEIDPDRARVADVQEAIGDNSRLREATGWAPEVPIRRSLVDTLSASEEG